jgi:hypothetical protein
MLARFVGKWKYVYDETMRTHWEQHFRARLGSEHAILVALASVDAEAADARIEITGSGEVASGSGGQEFYRAKLESDGETLCFVKPNGARVVLTLLWPDEIRAEEPGKPALRFLRIS